MSAVADKEEMGFELAGTFFRWSVSDHAKDLILIDRFTQMPAHEFFETIEDNFDRGRGPILLAMMATSIRRAHPDWSVERVVRKVSDISMSEVVWLGGEDEDEGEVEAPETGEIEEIQDSTQLIGDSGPENSAGLPTPRSKTSKKIPE